MSSALGIIAVDTGSTGAVTVNGAGSGWTTAGDLYVGSSGSATLTILNGGGVSIGGSSYLGVASGAIGAATVDGAGSSWTISGNLGMGSQGSGTLTIRNGGGGEQRLRLSRAPVRLDRHCDGGWDRLDLDQ